VGRGNIAQIQTTELIASGVSECNAKLDAIINHLNIVLPEGVVMDRQPQAETNP
jgi:hypothetical protein